METPGSGAATAVVWLWDLPTRLTHWSLVLLVPFSWWSAENDHLSWHRLSGYAILALVLFRLAWGLVGSDTARFSSFLKGPRGVLAYLRGGSSLPGHNPLGGWSVAAMLAALATQVGLGLFAVDEDGLDPSPLARFVDFETGRAVAKLHHITFNVLLGLICLHIAAVVFYAVRGSNLVGPMITGRRRMAFEGVEPRRGSLWAALALAAGACALAWFAARGLRL